MEHRSRRFPLREFRAGAGGLLILLLPAALDHGGMIVRVFWTGEDLWSLIPTGRDLLPTAVFYLPLLLALAGAILLLDRVWCRWRRCEPLRGATAITRAFTFAAAVAFPLLLAIHFTNHALIGPRWLGLDQVTGPARSVLLPAVLVAGLWGFTAAVAGVLRVRLRVGRSPGRLCRAVVAVFLAIGPLLAATGEIVTAANRPSVTVASMAERPNVLLITIDTLRRDHMTPYGYRPGSGGPTSETLRRMIDPATGDAVLFTNGYSSCSWTGPSTASILTSLHPSSHALDRPMTRLNLAVTTLPELMQAAGYETGGFSGNVFVSPTFGFDQGFDRFVVPAHDANPRSHIEGLIGLFNKARGVERVRSRAREKLDRARAWLSGRQIVYPKRSNSLYLDAKGVTDHALDWLRQPRSAPFFAYLHYMDPHNPYAAPEADRTPPPPGEPNRDGAEASGFAPFDNDLAIRTAAAQAERDRTVRRRTPEQIDQLQARYDDEIRYVDAMIRRVIDDLREQNLYDNTLIIITADHGEEFYDHRNWSHGHSLYEEQIQVPLIVKLPKGDTPTTKRVDPLVRTIDIAPTILDRCGITGGPPVTGRSLMPLLTGRPSDWKRVYPMAEIGKGNWTAQSIFDGRFKLIVSERKSLKAGKETVERSVQLFDLGPPDPSGAMRHPREILAVDLERNPDYETRAHWLAQRLVQQIEAAQRLAVAGRRQAAASESTRELLRGLGYLR